MAETIYDELLRTGQELLQFQGYLDTEHKNRQLKVQNAFNAQRNRIVYDLLHQGIGAEEATDAVTRDFAAIRADTPDYYAPVVDHVEGELIARIDTEARKSPLRRKIVRWTPAGLAVAAILAYGGIRVYSAVPITQSIETRAGIEQRAAAFSKVVRHEEWTDTRRNRLVMEILAWPIAPTDEETKGATEFAGLVLGGRSALAGAKAICGAPGDGAQLGDADMALIGRVAEHIRQPGIKWLKPPAYTLLPSIQESYPCR